jgi:hypothetical protein
LEVPLYSVWSIKQITQSQINTWRMEREKKKKQNIKEGIKKAKETKLKNQSIVREFYEKEWKEKQKKW